MMGGIERREIEVGLAYDWLIELLGGAYNFVAAYTALRSREICVGVIGSTITTVAAVHPGASGRKRALILVIKQQSLYLLK